MKQMKYYLIILILSLSSILFAQDFKYQAQIEAVNKNAFYKIKLSPEISTQLKSNFYDIRLFDSEHNEIPYLYSKEEPLSEKALFCEYEIIDIEHFKNYHHTRIVIRNPERTAIDNLVLKVKNADVRKQLKLNASNDRETWYVLKDNYFYNSIANTKSTSEIRVLNFPLSDYEFYEILIEDFFDKPINILKAGYYNHVKENGKFTILSDLKYAKKDSLKQTIISIPTQGQLIDKITFDISHPKYFYRQAQIYTKELRKSRKKDYVTKKVISNFKLVSNSSNAYIFNPIKADTIYIAIENLDDKALTIDQIQCAQLNHYLTAELKANQSYILKYSDEKLEKAKYDLQYFQDSIPENIKLINCSNIQNISSVEDTPEGNLNIESYWLWAIIIAVVLLLAYMSFKMINDNKLKEH